MVYISAFIVALVVLLLFSPRYVRGASILPIIVFFLVLFLAGLASRYWVSPYGPIIWGVSWVPMLIIVLLVGLLFSAPFPYYKYAKRNEQDAAETAAVSLLAWIIVLVLLGLVIAGIYKGEVYVSMLHAAVGGI